MYNSGPKGFAYSIRVPSGLLTSRPLRVGAKDSSNSIIEKLASKRRFGPTLLESAQRVYICKVRETEIS